MQDEDWREAEFRTWSGRICQALRAPELPGTAIRKAPAIIVINITYKALTVGFMPSAAEKLLSTE